MNGRFGGAEDSGDPRRVGFGTDRMSRLIKKDEERRKSFWKRVVDLAFTDVRVVAGGLDEGSLMALEERLLAADFGVQATLRLVGHVEQLARRGKVWGEEQLREALKEEVLRLLEPSAEVALARAEHGPTVYLVLGVNGTGKTTSIAKLAHRFRTGGESVLMAAADTFRAGAVEQLELWSRRVGVEFVGGQKGGDPAAVAYDAIEAAEARGIDVVLIDTAGRLHTRSGLMEELRKVDRVIRRRLAGAPHETLLVLDATVGQNGVAQLRAFREIVEVSGIVLAKMDSTAKGGVIVAIQAEFGVPVKLVGTGERPGDLEEFSPEEFVEGVFAG